jgi:hypothetical protein
VTDTITARPEPLRGPRTAPDGKRFVWGVITTTHEVGPYAIVEYRRDASNGTSSMWAEHGKTYFHPYVDGKDTSMAYGSLDAALAGVIGYRAEGPNGHAAHYFMRMIGADRDL